VEKESRTKVRNEEKQKTRNEGRKGKKYRVGWRMKEEERGGNREENGKNKRMYN
jgi:hypothetical protein